MNSFLQWLRQCICCIVARLWLEIVAVESEFSDFYSFVRRARRQGKVARDDACALGKFALQFWEQVDDDGGPEIEKEAVYVIEPDIVKISSFNSIFCTAVEKLFEAREAVDEWSQFDAACIDARIRICHRADNSSVAAAEIVENLARLES